MSESLYTDQVGTVTVIRLGSLYENLTEIVLPKLQERMFQVVDTAEPPHVVVDLKNVVFFGTAFIEVLFRIWHRVNRRDGRFALCGLREYPREVLRVAKLDSVWKIYPDAETASQAFVA
jgi:anti-anti-sigma factor